jgi:hypothetical protein
MVGGIYIDMGGDEVYCTARHSGTAEQLQGVAPSEEPSNDRGSRKDCSRLYSNSTVNNRHSSLPPS